MLEDINFNLLKYNKCKYTQDYLGIPHGHGFYACINRPTRMRTQCASFIDLKGSDDYSITTKCGSLSTDITDHYAPFIIRACKYRHSNIQINITYQDFDNIDITALCDILQGLPRECQFNYDVSDSCEKFSLYHTNNK